MFEEEVVAAPPGAAGETVPATAAPSASVASPAALGAALAASALLAACGGGGGGDGSGGGSAGPSGAGSLAPLANTSTAAGYMYTSAKSDAEAARFLNQAQGYATDGDIAAVRSLGYLPWLAGQFDAAPTQGGWDWFNGRPDRANLGFDNMIWAQLMASPDAARKRMALALSEIFVVSGNDIQNMASFPHHVMAGYWDTLVAGVTGNFRNLLEAVSLNPGMGYYLNTKGNQKENNQGRQPDENYAREVMQLMTIGLVQLDSKGQPRTAADGSKLDSYTQDDVTNLARVFTGYDLNVAAGEENASVSTNWTARPMALFPARHSTLAANFLGASVPGGTDGKAALKTALDTLHAHPNVGPFIGKQLIQRLVTSNPSPDYVGRVTSVFENNGAGVRGDMRSVFAAVLLDNEARSPAGLSDANFGRLREPMLRLVQWGRTFGISSAVGSWGIGNTSDSASSLGQSPLRSPSVFNFFRPGYVPPSTAMAGSGMVAPEFQLVNETSVGGYLNFMQGRLPVTAGFNSKDVIASYASEKNLVLDASALVDRLNLLLCAGQLSKASTDLMKSALATPALTAASSDTNKMNRVYAAVLMVMGCPEYLVQK